jgi:hypothetical protein
LYHKASPVKGRLPGSGAPCGTFTGNELLPDPVNGQADITELYVRQWGQPRPGSRVFVEVIQQINGWRHLPFRFSALVPAA